jgi:hypothetical protein
MTLIWRPFAEATRRGAVRGFVAVTLRSCGLTVFHWASYQGSGPSGWASPWHAVAWAFTVWSPVWFALALMVTFFNWPKFTKPPAPAQ